MADEHLPELTRHYEHFIWNSARWEGFKHRNDDILICTAYKAGTTWMQQIVHGLRSGGDMSFGEITQVVPWIELAHDLGLDIPGDQPSPRAFKSHLSWHDIPKGGRYIVVMRDPLDAARAQNHRHTDIHVILTVLTGDVSRCGHEELFV